MIQHGKEIWRRVKDKSISNGTLIYSDIQTDAIGTHGRKWYTDEKENIAFSFYIKLNCNIEKINGLTIEIAETIKKILKEKYKIKVTIKPPNDIYYLEKKLGGILTETKIYSNKIKYIVVGIGLNTNKRKFEGEIKNIGTSIINEFGIKINKEEFITYFCNEFENKIINLGE